ncbi:hypothetical protein A3D78_00930 [Candidatus Gottesmanbacteria bacterium RIFCSPHIGHO2_02_FULL_39_14]|uniref:Uncharacterized protein n=1 Tax=Candidatus Gottesmanbacteria bacterium RIFCSPHIGHO2_02_FULL_39_14 TaxID=1798383 RepID=A0A1F6A0A2_9BACT|nr:MAG: hypothetical protein A3D78_00930 [Candidatus Gottesmanbacteria bacterium RIFCSPHIGHO2_02_FULL_39_14]
MIAGLRFKTIITVFISCLFIILKVSIVNFDSTSGREFENLTSMLKKLQYENALLSQKVASASSILTITQKAKLLGFNQQKTLISLYGPQSLAAAENGLH